MNDQNSPGVQAQLFNPPAGRHEKMLTDALDAARESGLIEKVDGALVSLAIANAFALDRAETTKNAAYAISNVTGPYREVLQALGMTPEQRKEDANDEFTAALEALNKAEVRDPAAQAD